MANSPKSLAGSPFNANRNYFADPDDNPLQAAAALPGPPDASDGVPAEAEDAANDFDNWELPEEEWAEIAAATP